jgi:predicted lipoprotein
LPVRIEGDINSASPIDQSFLDRLGATSKGLSAVEYLLFERGDLSPDERMKAVPVLELLSGTNSTRRTAFLLALVREVKAKASQLAADWASPGESGVSAKFVAAGQESVNLLVNQLASGLEYEAERHLHFVLVLPNPISRQLYRVERSRSGTSLAGVLAGLEGLQKMYRGGEGLGLDDALQRVNAPLAKRIEDQFQAALETTKAIGAPLEQAAVDHRSAIEAAYDKMRALEILIKVDLASALGVTLTFSSNDGD